MHSLRITHQEELLCKFIHRHPHPVCCTECHVVAVQVLGSHTAVVVVAVLDEAVQIVNRVQLEEKAAFDRFSDLMAKLMVKHGPSVLRRRKERLIEAIRSSVDINPGIPPEEVSRRLNAYHNTIDRCRK